MGCDVHEKWIVLLNLYWKNQPKKGVRLNSGTGHISDKYGTLLMAFIFVRRILTVSFLKLHHSKLQPDYQWGLLICRLRASNLKLAKSSVGFLWQNDNVSKGKSGCPFTTLQSMDPLALPTAMSSTFCTWWQLSVTVINIACVSKRQNKLKLC